VALALAALAATAPAQITVDGAGPLTPVAGQFTIDESLGLVRGSNLFHSFATFGLDTGQLARFTGPSPIDNILARVTGGSLSSIDGTIDTLDYPGASLFLLNPSGIVFGPNASLQIDGGFHASSADHVRLADGTLFDQGISLAPSSSLTASPPEAFGFVTDGPGPITVQGRLAVGPGQTLSLIGGNVDIVGTGNPGTGGLTASGGRINLASALTVAAEVGEVVPVADVPELRMVGFAAQGRIDASNRALLNAGGPGGGSLFIRAGTLVADNALLFASTTAVDSSPPAAVGVDIRTTGETLLDNGTQVGANVFTGVAQGSAGTRIDAGQLTVRNASIVDSTSRGPGGAGDVELIGRESLTITNGASVSLRTIGGGPGGTLRVGGQSITISNGATVSNMTVQSFSPGGQIIVTGTGPITVSNGASVGTTTQQSFGASGEVRLDTPGVLTIANGAVVFSQSVFSLGAAGNIGVDTGNVTLTNPGGFFTALLSQTFGGSGAAGKISVETGQLTINGRAEISTPTFGVGRGGDIDIIADSLAVSGAGDANATGIYANTFGGGSGGHLQVQARTVDVADRSSLQAGSIGAGPGGGATIVADELLRVRGGSFVSTGAVFSPFGDAGDLVIEAGRVEITGINTATDPALGDFTGLTASAVNGRGGLVSVTGESIEIADKAQVANSSLGAGPAGTLRLDATNALRIVNGGQVTSVATASGAGGLVDIRAGSLLVEGVNPNPNGGGGAVDAPLSVSAISAQAQASGDAGDIQIDAGRVDVRDGGSIDTDTFGTGAGGEIRLSTGQLVVTGSNAALGAALGNPFAGRSQISATTEALLLEDGATGNGGRIAIDADSVEVLDLGLVTTSTTTPGLGGNIDIATGTITVAGDGRITAVSTARPFAADAGNVTVTASGQALLDGGIVSSASGTASAGGDVRLSASQVLLRNGSFVSARNLDAGDGGVVVVQAGSDVVNDASTITVSAEQGRSGNLTIQAGRDVSIANGGLVTAETFGAGDTGDVLIVATRNVELDSGQVLTEAHESDGGNIKITADEVVLLVDSAISSSVGTGQGQGGNITIDPIFVVLNNSTIQANAFGGPGGNITIVTDHFLANPTSVVEASSARSIDGQIVVTAPETDVNSALVTLPSNYMDAASRLAADCSARTSEAAATLVGEGRGGLPPAPGGPMISYYAPTAAPVDSVATPVAEHGTNLRVVAGSAIRAGGCRS
jgi:filamentous hemagglutinin family protein